MPRKKQIQDETQNETVYKHSVKQVVIVELNSILERFNKEEDRKKYQLLFTTEAGFIKADLWIHISPACPEVDIYDPYFYKNQELTLDSCYHKSLFSGDPLYPIVCNDDVLALKNVTIYSNNQVVKVPCFLLFVDKITGVNMVKKEFKI
ncbi:hypothetical protein [Fusobacterium ulcerans]|uniref:hypothetical protein n=1 Tax=Fusobacterium ulcerans TaxID=861 RepID=UPI0027B8ACBD|nr:hypothetical protein [Fusobacterium ulcerans]